jgi:hypothetical protein
MCWMTGARLVEVEPLDLEGALDPRTWPPSSVRATSTASRGRSRCPKSLRSHAGGGVPGIVDAAFLNYPPASMRRFVDLVCFSAKHYYGPSGAASSAAAAT